MKQAIIARLIEAHNKKEVLVNFMIRVLNMRYTQEELIIELSNFLHSEFEDDVLLEMLIEELKWNTYY